MSVAAGLVREGLASDLDRLADAEILVDQLVAASIALSGEEGFDHKPSQKLEELARNETTAAAVHHLRGLVGTDGAVLLFGRATTGIGCEENE